MKTILSLLGGAITLTEESGVFTLSFNESLGGGSAAGIVKGSGSFVLSGTMGLQLAEKLLNAHLPTSLATLAPAVEAIVNTAVAAVE